MKDFKIWCDTKDMRDRVLLKMYEDGILWMSGDEICNCKIPDYILECGLFVRDSRLEVHKVGSFKRSKLPEIKAVDYIRGKEPRFKVGDRVFHTIFKEGTIVEISQDGTKLVEFDCKNERLHNGGSFAKKKHPENHCYWCFDVNITSIESKDRNEIIITRDGLKVTAKDTISGVSGIARCNPGDKFDFGVGAKLAIGRLIDELYPKPYKEVKRIARVGEYVRVLSEDGHSRKRGEILKVTEVLDRGWVRVGERRGNVLRDSQYVVLDGYKTQGEEPKEEPKKLLNTKICIVNNGGCDSLTTGKIYEIKDGTFKDDNGDGFPTNQPLRDLEDAADYFRMRGKNRHFHYSGEKIEFVEVVE